MTDSLQIQDRSLRSRLDKLSVFVPVFSQAEQFESWHKQVLGSLLIRLRNHHRHLSAAYAVSYELEYLAWAARNLLELSIWAKYATTSIENARRLHDDQVVDVGELVKSTLSLVDNYVPNHPELATLQQQDSWAKATKGTRGIDEKSKHLRIIDVADDVGVGELFSGYNRLLSKLVHPTAFSIMLNLDQADEETLRRSIFALGLGAAEDTVRILVATFESVGIDCQVIQSPES